MSCNGCRVLRRGCSQDCVLRPCLEWIEAPQAQGNAVLFVSKFFGRTDLISFVTAVPANRRPALFKSLLVEACGRTVNPVGGAVGLLSTGNWHLCQAAVESVLAGGSARPVAYEEPSAREDRRRRRRRWGSASTAMMHESETTRVIENTASFGSGASVEEAKGMFGCKNPLLLNLFA